MVQCRRFLVIVAKNRQFGYKLFAVRVRPVAFRMSRQSHPDIQVDTCDRCSASKKNLVPARTLLIFAVVFALTALRVRPPEFVSFASHDCASTHEVKDKKQCLERTGTEFAVQTASIGTAPPAANFVLPPAQVRFVAQPSKGAYHNRPPPLG
jgi:hypothetical protein